MMRDKITRTMSSSVIHACRLVVEEGHPKVENLEPLIIAGKASEKDAIKALRTKYGKAAQISVTKIETSEATYEISVEDFLKHATKIEKTAAAENN